MAQRLRELLADLGAKQKSKLRAEQSAKSQSEIAAKLKSDARAKYPPPTKVDLIRLELKILDEKEFLSLADIAAIPHLLRYFSQLSRAVRLLSASDSPRVANMAGKVLAQEAYENTRHIYSDPNGGMRAVAACLEEFPVLIPSRIPSAKTLLDRLRTVKAAAELTPDYDSISRSKNDAFAFYAKAILNVLEEEVENIRHISTTKWLPIRKDVEKTLIPLILADKDVVAELSALLSNSDRKYPSRAKQRIKERILARLDAKLGQVSG